MATVVRSGFYLDRDRNAGGRDRHRVDVSPALPRQRVPQPPALRPEGGERALHLVLRASAYSTATSERKPVASVETQPGDHASQRRLSGVREPAILLATRVVHAAIASSSQPAPNALALSVGSTIA